MGTTCSQLCKTDRKKGSKSRSSSSDAHSGPKHTSLGIDLLTPTNTSDTPHHQNLLLFRSGTSLIHGSGSQNSSVTLLLSRSLSRSALSYSHDGADGEAPPAPPQVVALPRKNTAHPMERSAVDVIRSAHLSSIAQEEAWEVDRWMYAGAAAAAEANIDAVLSDLRRQRIASLSANHRSSNVADGPDRVLFDDMGSVTDNGQGEGGQRLDATVIPRRPTNVRGSRILEGRRSTNRSPRARSVTVSRAQSVTATHHTASDVGADSPSDSYSSVMDPSDDFGDSHDMTRFMEYIKKFRRSVRHGHFSDPHTTM